MNFFIASKGRWRQLRARALVKPKSTRIVDDDPKKKDLGLGMCKNGLVALGLQPQNPPHLAILFARSRKDRSNEFSYLHRPGIAAQTRVE